MRFTEEEVIRMNITLGITGDMFRERGVFFTDFMAPTNTVAELNAAENMKRKKTLRLKSMMIAHLLPGEIGNNGGDLSDIGEEDDDDAAMNGETVDPT